MTTAKKRRKPLNIDKLVLKSGAHKSPSAGLCVMEAVAYVAGETHSDHPQCASPVLSSFLRSLNDQWNDEARQMLKSLVPMLVGTNTGPADEQRRGLLAVDWLVREYVPTWLELAKLNVPAAALRHAAPIDSWGRLVELTPVLNKARAKADTAWTAAGDTAWTAGGGEAAWDAARTAAMDAARTAAMDAAAWDAARTAAMDAARTAAMDAAVWEAAWDAARTAAGKTLAPTVTALQRSAVELAKRMAAVGREGETKFGTKRNSRIPRKVKP